MRRIALIACIATLVTGCNNLPRRPHWTAEAVVSYSNHIAPNEDIKIAITFKSPLKTDATSKAKHD